MVTRFGRQSYYIFHYSTPIGVFWINSKLLRELEAAIGIEPMNKGFAETKWHCSLKTKELQVCAKTTT